MAYLINKASNTRCYLLSQHTFGRSKSLMGTLIVKSEISKVHAIIEWQSPHWAIRDISKNGTWLNNLQMQENKRFRLSVGDIIYFAGDKSCSFLVEDLSPPNDLLLPCDNDEGVFLDAIELNHYLILPNEESPEIAVYFNQQNSQWYQENLNQKDSQPKVINNKNIIEFDGKQWVFQQDNNEASTKVISDLKPKLKEIKYIFKLSLDEETTQVELHLANETIDLHIRTHHYLLLSLARYFIEDSKNGLDKMSKGWVYTEQLAKDLGIDTVHLNILIHRARKQFSNAFDYVFDTDRLIQRQPGKVRFGGEFFEIYKGDKLECIH